MSAAVQEALASKFQRLEITVPPGLSFGLNGAAPSGPGVLNNPAMPPRADTVESAGIELVMVDLVPTGFASSDAVIEAVVSKVAERGGPSAFAMGVISHLSSVPACVLPVARFCAALSGVPV